MNQLLKTEFKRLFLRDLVRLVALGVAIGPTLAGVGAYVTHSPHPDAESSQYDGFLEQRSADQAGRLEECLQGSPFDPSILPSGLPDDQVEALREQTLRDKSYPECRGEIVLPRSLSNDLRLIFGLEFPRAIEAIALPWSLLALVLGASFVGAEWRSGTMTPLLTWEPRRGRVALAKLLPVAVFVAGSYLLTVLLLFLSLLPAALTRGTFAGIGPLWREHVLGLAGRGLGLALLAALLGFAVALLIRNTVAAVGAILAWLVVAENVIRGFTSALDSWLVSVNAQIVYVGFDADPRSFPPAPLVGDRSAEEALSILGGYVLVIMTLAIYLFWRRDVQGNSE